MLSQPNTQTIPDQWFTDYADSGAYAMLSLTDYIALRQAGGSLAHCEISLVTA